LDISIVIIYLKVSVRGERENKRLYLAGGIDGCSRLAWIEDITSLSVMFGAMGIMRLLQSRYEVRFETVTTDNGSEFKSNNTMTHPFERLLYQLEIRHIYTKPCKPQANGKIERLWKTVYEEVLEETAFNSVEELQRYMIYYNEIRGNELPFQSYNSIVYDLL
jgi:transposase InsO family protein